jgi:hypothetical protein
VVAVFCGDLISYSFVSVGWRVVEQVRGVRSDVAHRSHFLSAPFVGAGMVGMPFRRLLERPHAPLRADVDGGGPKVYTSGSTLVGCRGARPGRTL